MEQQPVIQAFGSPGGKKYIAAKIVRMIPLHKTYVEPFAGGAAVYFKKAPSLIEVLGDKDSEIAFAFRFLRDMTLEQFRRLKRYYWRISRRTFNRLLRGYKPKNELERFWRFYYLKKASFSSGSASYSPEREGEKIDISRLWRVHERLRRTAVHNADALVMINKYDSPSAFFYLDPPYPGRKIARELLGNWNYNDLKVLVQRLRHIKGKFALSLGTEHARLLPKNWHIKRILQRTCIKRVGDSYAPEYEIIATNYNPLAKLSRPIKLKTKYPEPEKLLYN